MRGLPFLAILFCFYLGNCQEQQIAIHSFRMFNDVQITFDEPKHFKKKAETIIILFALPNGNNTMQTMGKKIEPGDDWHLIFNTFKHKLDLSGKN